MKPSSNWDLAAEIAHVVVGSWPHPGSRSWTWWCIRWWHRIRPRPCGHRSRARGWSNSVPFKMNWHQTIIMHNIFFCIYNSWICLIYMHMYIYIYIIYKYIYIYIFISYIYICIQINTFAYTIIIYIYIYINKYIIAYIYIHIYIFIYKSYLDN